MTIAITMAITIAITIAVTIAITIATTRAITNFPTYLGSRRSIAMSSSSVRINSAVANVSFFLQGGVSITWKSITCVKNC